MPGLVLLHEPVVLPHGVLIDGLEARLAERERLLPSLPCVPTGICMKLTPARWEVPCGALLSFVGRTQCSVLARVLALSCRFSTCLVDNIWIFKGKHMRHATISNQHMRAEYSNSSVVIN